MELIFITIFFLGFAILGISIKIWGKKGGEFSGTCASQNPMLNKNNEPCGFCGKLPEEFQDCASE
jgi:hypothetical protein